MPLYDDVEVQLSGHDGNAFAIVGRVRTALRNHLAKCDCPPRTRDDILQRFTDQAFSGDYDNLLRTCTEWVNVK